MKRKIMIFLVLGVLCISMIACNLPTGKDSKQNKNENKKTDVAQDNSQAKDVKSDEHGVEFNVPVKWKASQGRNLDMYPEEPEENILGQIVIKYILDETIDKGNIINEEIKKIPETDKAAIKKADEEIKNLNNEIKELCRIVTIDKKKLEGNAKIKLFSKYDKNDLIGGSDSYEIYLLYDNNPNTEGLSEKAKKAYEEYYKEVKAFKSLIHTYKPVSLKEKISKNKLEFNTKTLEGKNIDSSILKDSNLTMINIWATYCKPCIEEMPDLQKLYEEFKSEKVNVIGIISDTPDEETEALAKKILSVNGVAYTNIIPDEMIIKNILKNSPAVPTTLFVDSEGNIIGEIVVGSRGKEVYKKEIQDRLNSMK